MVQVQPDVVGVSDLLKMKADEFFGGVPKHFAQHLVGVDNASLQVYLGHADGRSFENRSKSSLFFFEDPFRLSALRNIRCKNGETGHLAVLMESGIKRLIDNPSIPFIFKAQRTTALFDFLKLSSPAFRKLGRDEIKKILAYNLFHASTQSVGGGLVDGQAGTRQIRKENRFSNGIEQGSHGFLGGPK